MHRKTERKSQDMQQPAKQQSREQEKKELTLEDLASVTGGFLSAESLLEASAKAEDRCGNKAEAE